MALSTGGAISQSWAMVVIKAPAPPVLDCVVPTGTDQVGGFPQVPSEEPQGVLHYHL